MKVGHLFITHHAQQRIRERCGIPKRAVGHRTWKAWTKGLSFRTAKGDLARFMKRRYDVYKKGNKMRAWDGELWVFQDRTLVTVVPLPNHLKSLETEQRKERDGRD